MGIQTDDFADLPVSPRVVSAAKASPQEEVIERALRPKRLADYIGQAKAREQLEIFISAARKRGEALDHVLLFGPPGLGKTTLSHIVAAELGVGLRQTSGPVLEKPKDLAAILTCLEKNDVGQRGLAQAGRAEQQHMVQRLAALACCADEDLELLTRLGLADVLGQQLGPQRALDRLLLR